MLLIETVDQFYLKTKDDIANWLDAMQIRKYNINTNLTVDVHVEVIIDGDENRHISKADLIALPIQFNKVFGNFTTLNTSLATLRGMPKYVQGHFNVGYNNLQNLDYMPATVVGSIFCHEQDTGLRTMKNIHHFLKRMNGGVFDIASDYNPDEVDYDYPDEVERTTLMASTLPTNMLGLYLVKGLGEILTEDENFDNIFNSYLQKSDVHACQEALIEAGYAQQARF